MITDRPPNSSTTIEKKVNFLLVNTESLPNKYLKLLKNSIAVVAPTFINMNKLSIILVVDENSSHRQSSTADGQEEKACEKIYLFIFCLNAPCGA